MQPITYGLQYSRRGSLGCLVPTHGVLLPRHAREHSPTRDRWDDWRGDGERAALTETHRRRQAGEAMSTMVCAAMLAVIAESLEGDPRRRLGRAGHVTAPRKLQRHFAEANRSLLNPPRRFPLPCPNRGSPGDLPGVWDGLAPDTPALRPWLAYRSLGRRRKFDVTQNVTRPASARPPVGSLDGESGLSASKLRTG